MSKIIALLVTLTTLTPLAVSAKPITDTVTALGKQWAQVDLFSSLTWLDINAVCPGGVCGDGSLDGHSMIGWSWASREDVMGLFNFYIGSNELSAPDNYNYYEFGSTWAPDFLSDFRITYEYANSLGARGWTSELKSPGSAYVAGVGEAKLSRLRDAAHTNGPVHTSSTARDFGGWFYREIPEPAPFALILLGLLGVVTSRKAIEERTGDSLQTGPNWTAPSDNSSASGAKQTLAEF